MEYYGFFGAIIFLAFFVLGIIFLCLLFYILFWLGRYVRARTLYFLSEVKDVEKSKKTDKTLS